VGLIATGIWVAGSWSGHPTVSREAAAAPKGAPTGSVTVKRVTDAVSPRVAANWVAVENQRPGTTAWRIPPNGPGVMAGFSNVVSAQAGDTVSLYVTTNAANFHVEAYRMGYYGGAGGRLVWTSAPVLGRDQPPCAVTSATNLVTCDNWTPSLRMAVTSAFVQGDYLLKLVGDAAQQSYVPLTVSDPSSHATYLVKNDVYTWQAWNPYGGYDLYTGQGTCPRNVYPPCNRARIVSFDRPYGYGQGAGDFLGNEYPLVRLAEQRGLDVTYATDADVEADPGLILNHRVLLSLGHDECWSLTERLAAQRAEQHGVNLVFFGASPILRHVRLQPSVLGPDREEVDYRQSTADPLDGRSNPLLVTGNTWSSPPADWSETPFVGETYSGYLEPGEPSVPLVVTDAAAWLYRGTGLHDGSVLPSVLDSDFDQVDPMSHPADLQILAHSPMPATGVQTSSRVPYSDMTYYTDPASGAAIFDTGTCAWIPDITTTPVIAQMTVNLLAALGPGSPERDPVPVPNWQQLYP
jgi:hypothetical protein